MKAVVTQSADGTSFAGTLGTIVSAAGTNASGQVYYETFTATQRWLRCQVIMAGAGGTALAGVTILAKPRTVAD